MKKFLALALAALILACGTLAGAEADGPGLRLLSMLYDGEHNQIVSPVSLAYALDMAAMGAAGATREEIEAALDGADPASWNEPLSASGLKLADAAFIRDDLTVKQDYIDALKARYGAEIFGLNDVEAVNAWVSEQTDGLIDQLAESLDPRTRMLLVNAIAMDAEWAHAFEPDDTREDVFHAPAGDVTADFMTDTFEMPYGESDLGQFIRLDYRDSGLYMLALLPKEGRMEDTLQALAEDWQGCFEGMTRREVWLRLPKLDASASNSLSGELQALGIRRAFTEEADFSGISDEPLYIDDVIQKARVQMDEAGTKAAAATEVVMLAKGLDLDKEPPVDLRVDRPYIFLIAEESTGAVCFAGVVCDPTQH